MNESRLVASAVSRFLKSEALIASAISGSIITLASGPIQPAVVFAQTSSIAMSS